MHCNPGPREVGYHECVVMLLEAVAKASNMEPLDAVVWRNARALDLTSQTPEQRARARAFLRGEGLPAIAADSPLPAVQAMAARIAALMED